MIGSRSVIAVVALVMLLLACAPMPTPADTAAASAAPSLGAGEILGIRYAGTGDTEFSGVITARFDDGAVAQQDASGVVRDPPVHQSLGQRVVAVRVTGTILSRDGTYRIEIVRGHLDGAGVFTIDGVLAVAEGTGRDTQIQADFGNVDL